MFARISLFVRRTCALALLSVATAGAQDTWVNTGIGGASGTPVTPSGGSVVVVGSGSGAPSQYYYVHTRKEGETTVSAKVQAGTGKAGIAIHYPPSNATGPSDTDRAFFLYTDNGAIYLLESDGNPATTEVPKLVPLPRGTDHSVFNATYLKLVRRRADLVAWTSSDGEVWWPVGGFDAPAGVDRPVIAGLFSCVSGAGATFSEFSATNDAVGNQSSSIAAGYYHTLLVRPDGTVVLWGTPDDYVPLPGDTDPASIPPISPQVVTDSAGEALRRVVSVTAASTTCYALTWEGRVYSWYSDRGQALGNQIGTTFFSLPAEVDIRTAAEIAAGAAPPRIVAIAGQALGCAAIDVNGRVRTWGYNDALALGVATPQTEPPHHDDSRLALLVDLSEGSVQERIIALGGRSSHYLALGSTGTVWGWGSNEHQKLSLLASSPLLPLKIVSGETMIVEVAAGLEHSLARTKAGAVLGRGRSANGELGPINNGSGQPIDFQNVIGFVGIGLVAPPFAADPVVALATGRHHTLAIVSNASTGRRAVSVGANEFGQLGAGITALQADVAQTITIPGGQPPIFIRAGYDTGFVVDTNWQVFAWGQGTYNRLGNGSELMRNAPVAVPGVSFTDRAPRFPITIPLQMVAENVNGSVRIGAIDDWVPPRPMGSYAIATSPYPSTLLSIAPSGILSWNFPVAPTSDFSVEVVAIDQAGPGSTGGSSKTSRTTVNFRPAVRLSGISYNGNALPASENDAPVVSGTSGTLTTSVASTATVANVAMYVNGSAISTTASGLTYSATLNLAAIQPGALATIAARMTRTDGTIEEITRYLRRQSISAPAAPVIVSPSGSVVVNTPMFSVSGTAEAGSQVQLHRAGGTLGSPVTADSNGNFNIGLTLAPSQSVSFAAKATNGGGTSPLSNEVTVTYTPPTINPPQGVTASADRGTISVSWLPPVVNPPPAVNLALQHYVAYEFIKNEAGNYVQTASVQTNGLTLTFNRGSGTYYYEVEAVFAGTNNKARSPKTSVTVDVSGPVITSIVLARVNGSPIGQSVNNDPLLVEGLHTVTVEFDEPLGGIPTFGYRSLTSGAYPFPIDLIQSGPKTYRGQFLVSRATPDGRARPFYSARDRASNVAGETLSGNAVEFATKGPVMTSVVRATGSSAIQNLIHNSGTGVTPVFTVMFDRSIESGEDPQFTYVLGNGSPTAIAGKDVEEIAGFDRKRWSVRVPLDSAAGQSAPTSLTLRFTAFDIYHVAGDVSVARQTFLVYQGSLPPLLAPAGFVATPVANGGIKLAWNEVVGQVDNETISYRLVRPALPAAGGLAATPEMVYEGDLRSYTDNTPVDRAYEYQLFSVRRDVWEGGATVAANSVLPATTQATSDRVPPSAPFNVQIALHGHGVQIGWEVTPGEGTVKGRVYRRAASGAPVVVGTYGATLATDTAPIQGFAAYSVRSLDAAGNEGLASAEMEVNIGLLPVTTMAVRRMENLPPTLTWTAANASSRRFLIRYGSPTSYTENAEVLGTAPLSLVDERPGSTEERRYEIKVKDPAAPPNSSAALSLSRTLVLPKVSIVPAAPLKIARGVMNTLRFEVQNTGTTTASDLRVRVTPAGGRRPFPSLETLTLQPNAKGMFSVVVPGESTFPLGGQQALEVSVDSEPHVGEIASNVFSMNALVEQGRTEITFPVLAGFTRGTNATVQFKVKNVSDTRLEFLSARSSSLPSDEVILSLVDAAGNVFATTPLNLVLGSNVVTSYTGRSVVRVEGGAEFESPLMNIAVPLAAPDQLYVQLSVQNFYFNEGGEGDDRIVLSGLAVREDVVVRDTPYFAKITGVAPNEVGIGNPVLITGKAILRGSSPEETVPNADVKVRVSNGNFQKQYLVVCNSSGVFNFNYTPLAGDPSGVYSITATHPDITERPPTEPGNKFTLGAVWAEPKRIVFSAPYGTLTTPAIVPTVVRVGPIEVTNLHWVHEPVGGESLPTGFSMTSASSPVTGLPNEIAPLQIRFSTIEPQGGNTLDQPSSGRIPLKLVGAASDGRPVVWDRVEIYYYFARGIPAITLTPGHLRTGAAYGTAVTDVVKAKNTGLGVLENVRVQLAGGATSVPSWVSIDSAPTRASLAPGEEMDILVGVRPGQLESQGGVQAQILLKVLGDFNGSTMEFQPGQLTVVARPPGDALGGLRFTVAGSDGYIGGARVNVKRDPSNPSEPPQFPVEMITASAGSSQGVATFEGLVAGSYSYSVSAPGFQTYHGRTYVRTGVLDLPVFVPMVRGGVTVNWEVVPITIQDRYELILNLTFAANVPEPVLAIEPPVLNLPRMCEGDVYYGEVKVTNYGLIAAQNVAVNLPSNDAYFTYEFLGTLPTTLAAGQSVRMPYRMTAVRALAGNCPTGSGGSSGAPGLLSATTDPAACAYNNTMSVTGDFVCINGIFGRTCGYMVVYYRSRSCGPPVVYGSIPVPPWLPGPPSASGFTNPVLYPISWGTSSPSTPIGGLECIPPPKACPAGPSAPGTDEAADCGCDQNKPTFSTVNLARRQYEDEVTDLTVSVAYGATSVRRRYYNQAWHFDYISSRLDVTQFQPAEPRPATIDLGRNTYVAIDSARTVYEDRGNRIYFEEAETPVNSTDGNWRWRSRDGAWQLYNKDGLLQSVGRGQGNAAGAQYDNLNITQLKFTYDGARLVSIDAPTASGFAPAIYFGWTGSTSHFQPTSAWDAADVSRKYVYTWVEGLLTNVQDACLQDWSYTYDRGRLVTKTDPDGRTITMVYRPGPPAPAGSINDYLVSAKDSTGEGFTFDYSYDQIRREYYARDTTASGRVTESWFNSEGKLFRVKVNGILTRTIVYDGAAEIETDANGHSTRREMDRWSNVTLTRYHDGAQSRTIYDPVWNKPAQITNERGTVTKSEYDAFGRLKKLTENPGGGSEERVTTYIFDDAAGFRRLKEKVDPAGTVWAYGYVSNSGLLQSVPTTIEAKVGGVVKERTTFEYNSQGQPLFVNASRNPEDTSDTVRTAFTYDKCGRVETTTYNAVPETVPNTRAYARLGNLRHMTRFVYSPGGKLLAERSGILPGTVADPAQSGSPIRITKYEYDQRGRRTKVKRVGTDGSDKLWSETVYDGENRVQAEFDALRHQTTYHYNSRGWLETKKEPWKPGQTADTSYTYDGVGNVLTKTDASGRVWGYTYDSRNRVKVMTDGSANISEPRRETIYTYDSDGALLTETMTYNQADDTTVYQTIYTYDALGRRLTVGGNRLHKKIWKYNSAGNVVEEQDGRLETTKITHEYDHRNRLTRSKDASGALIAETDYDALGNPIVKRDGEGRFQNFIFDAHGRLTVESIPRKADEPISADWEDLEQTDPLVEPTGYRQKAGYNAWGQIIVTSDCKGARTTAEFDCLGRMTVSTNVGTSLRLEYDYDDLDRRTAVRYPAVADVVDGPVGLGTSEITRYELAHPLNIAGTTDRAGNSKSHTYDALGRMLTEVTSTTGTTTTQYDKLGRVESVLNTLGEKTIYSYNALDQPTRIQYPDHTEVHRKEEIRKYTSFGKLEEQRGTVYPLSYTYDSAGNLETMTDKKTTGSGAEIAGVTKWTYDLRNRNFEKEFLDGTNRRITYYYDQGNLLRSRTDMAGRTTQYEYKGDRSLIKIDYGASLVSDPENAAGQVIFGYDAMGRRIIMLDWTGTTRWSYEGSTGHVLRTTQGELGAGPVREVVYQYDAEGRRKSMRVQNSDADPSPWTTDYRYDPSGRIVRLHDSRVVANSETGLSEPFVFRWEAGKAHNLPREIEAPVGVKTSREFDELGRIRTLTAASTLAFGIYDQRTYTYNTAGQRQTEIASVGTAGNRSFVFDNQRQVASASRDSVHYGYSYDELGNRRSASLTTETGTQTFNYAANRLNQYTVAPGSNPTAIAYDHNGNTVSDSTGLTFTWSVENRLLEVTGRGKKSEHLYDGFGRRVRTLVTNLSNSRIERVRWFVYDGWREIEEWEQTSPPTGQSFVPSLRHTFTRGPDLSGSLEGAGGIGGILAITRVGPDGGTGMTYSDPIGNILLTLNSAVPGVILAQFEYGPFGEIIHRGDFAWSRVASGSSYPQPLAHAGKYVDVESGLCYYGYRYYETDSGRWLSRDPIGESGGVNLYGFVRNEPLSHVDPLGLSNYGPLFDGKHPVAKGCNFNRCCVDNLSSLFQYLTAAERRRKVDFTQYWRQNGTEDKWNTHRGQFLDQWANAAHCIFVIIIQEATGQCTPRPPHMEDFENSKRRAAALDDPGPWVPMTGGVGLTDRLLTSVPGSDADWGRIQGGLFVTGVALVTVGSAGLATPLVATGVGVSTATAVLVVAPPSGPMSPYRGGNGGFQ